MSFQIPASTQPTIAEAFAKKPKPSEPQTTETHEPPLPAEPVIEVTSSPPVTSANVSESESESEVIVEKEPRPTTTKVAGTKLPDGCES